MGFLRSGTNANTPPAYTGVQIQTSAEGMVLSVVYGTNRIAPNLIWTDNFQSRKIRNGKKGGGGGKGGGKSGSSAEYFAGCILALCEGPIAYGVIYQDQSTVTSAASLNLTEYAGTPDQTPFDCISTKPGFVPLSYRDVAYLATNSYDLGQSATLPQHNCEIIGFLSGGVPSVNSHDAQPALCLFDICTNARYGLGMPTSLLGDLTPYNNYCSAYGLIFSPALDKQEQAISILQRWAQLTNSWMFWSENTLKVVPLGDTSLTANGFTFTANNTVLYDLTYDDFYDEKSGDPPVSVSRSEPSKAYNWVKLDCRDRDNNYATATAEYKDQTSITRFGTFQANSISASEICDRGVASTVVGLIGNRALYIRNTYKFSLSYNFVLLEPGDIVSLTDAAIGLDRWPVRIRTMAEDEHGRLSFEAEECPSGTGSGVLMQTQLSLATQMPALDIDPGPVNTPAILEPALVVTANTPQVWIGASGASGYWGGATVYLSVDDVTYIPVGTISATTPQGVLLADLPVHVDPDTVDTLSVNLTESLTVLSGSVTDEDADALRSLALVGSEQLSYGSVVPNGTNAYSSDLTYLRRGVYNTTIADHPIGTLFSAIVPDNMLQVDLPRSYVGVPIYVKLTSFNVFGGGTEDISSVTRYTYLPAGVGYSINAPSAAALAITTPTGATSISLTLTWVASPGPALGSYEVQMSSDAGSTWTAADIALGASALAFTLASATPNTDYQGRVRAISAGGLATSGWSTSAVVNSGVSPVIPGGGSELPLVNGDIPIGIMVAPDGVPVYVVQ